LTLGKIAYYVEKGKLDIANEITIKDLFYSGAISKIPLGGVKLVKSGHDKIEKMSHPLQIEANDATDECLEFITSNGGKITHRYRTPLILKQELKPHKIPSHKFYKTPMPA
jgi:hypothetical protein